MGFECPFCGYYGPAKEIEPTLRPYNTNPPPKHWTPEKGRVWKKRGKPPPTPLPLADEPPVPSSRAELLCGALLLIVFALGVILGLGIGAY